MFDLCPICGCPLTIDQSWLSEHSGKDCQLAHCPNCDGRYWRYAGEAWINRYENIPDSRG
ncbi:MAG: hypothetical protein P3T54_00275 [Dehalogenimonas sp.]|nr:hypothetical protein [Dehalogenimonas sp.]